MVEEDADGHPQPLKAGAKDGHVWSNELGEKRQAFLVDAPQSLPE